MNPNKYKEINKIIAILFLFIIYKNNNNIE